MSTLTVFLTEQQIIESVLTDLKRSVNKFNVKAYQAAVNEYKKQVMADVKVSHGVLVHRLASTFKLDARALDEMLTRMIKTNNLKKAPHTYISNDSDRNLRED